MARSSGISLSNKCQLLFGCAVVVILIGTLALPWVRTATTIRAYDLEVARRVADAWLAGEVAPGDVLFDGPDDGAGEQPADDSGEPGAIQDGDAAEAPPGMRIRVLTISQLVATAEDDPYLEAARSFFNLSPAETEFIRRTRLEDDHEVIRYARRLTAEQLSPQTAADSTTTPTDAGQSAAAGVGVGVGGSFAGLLVIDRSAGFASSQLLVSRMFIIASGLAAILLSVLAFYLILTRLILRPVRRLRETAERVEKGDLSIRSRIQTGDEFELLSDAFNNMLDKVEQSQQHLRKMNENLDLKIAELAEANFGLYESNRFKSEFLANVSHELRTPLNSIIGFAQLLDELARSDAHSDPKRRRYISNILDSGRNLLDMINELLEMAKIEAGRVEVSIAPTSIVDLVEGMIGIMGPQANAKNIALTSRVSQQLPMVDTDAGKLQQILYNFVSNAIKFTPEGGSVTIAADRIMRQSNVPGVRLSVADTGPGIPPDMQDVIFEKFRQIDASHTREHTGTGLGLAICRELAEMLSAEVSFVSEPGEGATFYVDLPLVYQPKAPQPLMG